MTKKIDLNIRATNLDGSPSDAILGKQIAGVLAQAAGIAGDRALKFWNWAMDLFAGAPLVLDEVDEKVLTDFVGAHQGLPVWLKAQVLKRIESGISE